MKPPPHRGKYPLDLTCQSVQKVREDSPPSLAATTDKKCTTEIPKQTLLDYDAALIACGDGPAHEIFDEFAEYGDPTGEVSTNVLVIIQKWRCEPYQQYGLQQGGRTIRCIQPVTSGVEHLLREHVHMVCTTRRSVRPARSEAHFARCLP